MSHKRWNGEKNEKRILFFSILSFFLLPAVCKQEGKAAPWPINGSCGPDMHWDITDEGVLTITGTGKMTDTPWRDEEVAVRQLNLGEGITTICNDAFLGYGRLSDVTLPQSLVEIGDQAFSCTNLKVVRMPDNVEKIGKDAFSECTNLEEIHISPKVKIIPQSSFEDCSKLKEIILPEGLEKIGKYAFRDCCSLKKLTIPKSVKKIEEKFIEDSIGIRTVTNLSKIKLPYWCGDRAPFWNTNVYWYVNGKKVKTLKTGQTAKAKPRVYPIVYRIKGARVKRKMPKNYTYGTETKLPTNVIKKGYVFYGWEYYENRVEDGWSLYSIKPTWGGKIRLTPGMARFRLKNAGKHRVEVYVDLGKLARYELERDDFETEEAYQKYVSKRKSLGYEVIEEKNDFEDDDDDDYEVYPPED